MRKVTSFLFISLDGVVESPNTFVRGDVFADIVALIGETVADQDTVLLGRRMYEEWSTYWPSSNIEPFATFINTTPKLVVSRTLREVGWSHCALLDGDLESALAELKARPGKTIGVHGSVRLVQSMLVAGLLDELRFLQFPVIAGQGRRLLEHHGPPIQLDLRSARATPKGLQYLVYEPRRTEGVRAPAG
jgi:dihydrofolate reductase